MGVLQRAGLCLAVAASVQLLLPVGFAASAARGQGVDVIELVKQLRKLRSLRDENASRSFRLKDEHKRSAFFRVVYDDLQGYYVAFFLRGKPIHVHTLRFTLTDGRSMELPLLPMRQSEDGPKGELVLAQLDEDLLATLGNADSMRIYARGWDEIFQASLDQRALSRLGSYYEKVSARLAAERKERSQKELREATGEKGENGEKGRKYGKNGQREEGGRDGW